MCSYLDKLFRINNLVSLDINITCVMKCKTFWQRSFMFTISFNLNVWFSDYTGDITVYPWKEILSTVKSQFTEHLVLLITLIYVASVFMVSSKEMVFLQTWPENRTYWWSFAFCQVTMCWYQIHIVFQLAKVLSKDAWSLLQSSMRFHLQL